MQASYFSYKKPKNPKIFHHYFGTHSLGIISYIYTQITISLKFPLENLFLRLDNKTLHLLLIYRQEHACSLSNSIFLFFKKKKLLVVGLHVGGPITNSYTLKFKIIVGAYGFIHSNKNPKL